MNRPEDKLLLYCFRTKSHSLAAECISLLAQEDLDWVYLLQIAGRHGVLPLLYQNLKAIYPDAFPQAVLDQLQQDCRASCFYNLFLTQELCEILGLFAAHDILAIPFKGPILAIWAYDNLALRQFGDLDILVQERDVPQAIHLLISQGYQLPNQLAEFREKPYLQFEQFLESASYQRSYDLMRNDERVCVELHWSLTGKNFSYPIGFGDLWSRINFVSFADAKIPNLSAEDLLLYLCVHGSRHCWEQLKWICDVAKLLEIEQQLDWPWILEQSSQLGVERMLGVGLLLAQELLGTTLPKNVLEKIQADATAQVLVRQVRERLFDSTLTDIEKHFFLVQVRERLSDKALYLRHLLFTPSAKEWAVLPLPKFLSFFYYLLRPINLLLDSMLAVGDR